MASLSCHSRRKSSVRMGATIKFITIQSRRRRGLIGAADSRLALRSLISPWRRAFLHVRASLSL